MEECGKAREQRREETARAAGAQMLALVAGERPGRYLTPTICEDAGKRKHAQSLARAKQGSLPHTWAPSPG